MSDCASADLLKRLDRVDTTLVSDALDALGLPSGTGALVSQMGAASIRGRVRTVELGPADPYAPSGPHIAARAIACAQPGDVIVVANQGRTDVSCWGGLLSLGGRQRGVRGVVADGACRDIAEARELGFPMFSRGVTPRTARGRLAQLSTGAPVVIDGIGVAEGDWVIADDSGVVFVPADRMLEVLERAEWARAQEGAIARDIRAGVGIEEAMHDARLTSASDLHRR